MQKINVGIIGAAGYTAGELLRILLNHPGVNIEYAQSTSHSGYLLSDVHRDLLGETELCFSDDWHDHVDVIFLCGGHGKSKALLNEYTIPADVKIIDLSNDFRIQADDNEFVYGLPEWNSKRIAQATRIANPGCFATAIELALLPLVQHNLLDSDIHVTAITGSTGAGQSPSETTHFSWKNNNVALYKAFTHQHLPEIHQVLNLNGNGPELNFIPVRGNFSRGILAACYTRATYDEAYYQKLYADFYSDAPFVHLTRQTLDVKQAVNTNKCILQVEVIEGRLLVTSAIDNLLKGASGQAVQNMNLMFGFEETMGLKLKASAF